MDKILNSQATTTSTGSGWFDSLLNTATGIYTARQTAKTAQAGQPVPAAANPPAPGISPMLLIGGAVALVVVLVLALKK